MIARPKIVLDANILVRATLGHRVRHLISSYEASIVFCAPEICFTDARRHSAALAIRQNADPLLELQILDRLSEVIEIIDSSYYEPYAPAARQRIGHREMDDWPIVATALLLNSPIWTEDFDFFGCGIATWTTATVELYLRDS